jgi:hypothetical protein
MSKPAIALALAAAVTLGALPAVAGEARTATPIEATSLAIGGVQMVAYFVPSAGDLYDVTATWIGTDGAAPQRLVLRLADGDRVSFGLPGHEGTAFTFAREIDAVTISAEPAATEFRSASL